MPTTPEPDDDHPEDEHEGSAADRPDGGPSGQRTDKAVGDFGSGEQSDEGGDSDTG